MALLGIFPLSIPRGSLHLGFGGVKPFEKKLELKLFLYFLFYFLHSGRSLQKSACSESLFVFLFFFFLTEKPPSMLFGELKKASLHKLI